MKADQLHQILTNNPSLPVLFVSRPIDGDIFSFGTLEELENELEAYEEADEVFEQVEFTTAGDLADRLDFATYEDQDITVFR